MTGTLGPSILLHKITMRAFVALLLVTAAAPEVAAQRPVILTRPAAEFAEPFSTVAGVRELSDGRLVVVDSRDKLVSIVDFDGQSSTMLGREGSGPGEYRRPGAPVALPGDTTLVPDGANGRYLVINPNGTVGAVITDNPGDKYPLRGRAPRGVDARGRLYFMGTALVKTPDGMASADSAAIIRFDRKSQLVDTVGFVTPQKSDVRVNQTVNQISSVSIMKQPFGAEDAWAVLPDGRVIVARVDDYHPDVLAPDGKRTLGKPIPFDRLPVTDADKFPDGNPTAAERRAAESRGYPEFKPPFPVGGGEADPQGFLWVLRTTRQTTDSTVYDVISPDGVLVRRVTMAPRSRIVGFGGEYIYAVRMDADDLQYLQRYSRKSL